jgi:hypothetical protein
MSSVAEMSVDELSVVSYGGICLRMNYSVLSKANWKNSDQIPIF